jgi:hypothetical protein
MLLFVRTAFSLMPPGKDVEEMLRVAARWQAEKDLAGMYRFLLAFTSPEAAVRRMDAVYKQYWSFGRNETLKHARGRVESCVHGMPVIMAKLFGLLALEFVTRVVTLAGGRSVVGRVVGREPDGVHENIALERVYFATTWDS